MEGEGRGGHKRWRWLPALASPRAAAAASLDLEEQQ
jgi:hypothetical protein